MAQRAEEVSATFADSGVEPLDFDDETFNNAARLIFETGHFDASMLSDPAVLELIKQTFNILSSAIGHGVSYEVPETLRYALENNAFTFSGFKTFHALREVGLSLLTPNGDIKPFSTFLNDVKAINDRYNHNYLRAEYQQAVAASQMAVRWHEFEKDGDRYDLQYRTANDSRVREEHAILHNTTLPASDPFWDSFLPPNGWGCRCTAVQVRKGKYPTSDPELAMRRGQNCTDGAKRKIFRFNPGKAMRLYPEQHPYFPKGCGSCPRKLNLAFDPKRQICIACKIIQDYSPLRAKIKPPKVETYKEHHNGKVFESPYHGPEELADNLEIAKKVADLIDEPVYLLPRLDPMNITENKLRQFLLPQNVFDGKNPDFFIGGKLYDAKRIGHKSSDLSREKQKEMIENRIKKAKKQADNIVLDISDDFLEEYIDETIRNYLNRSSKHRVIIVFHKGVGKVYEK